MAPYLYSADFVFTQEPDFNDGGGEQELRVQMQTAGAGPFLVLQTQRWAVDTPEELYAVLKRTYGAAVPLFSQFGPSEGAPS